MKKVISVSLLLLVTLGFQGNPTHAKAQSYSYVAQSGNAYSSANEGQRTQTSNSKGVLDIDHNPGSNTKTAGVQQRHNVSEMQAEFINPIPNRITDPITPYPFEGNNGQRTGTTTPSYRRDPVTTNHPQSRQAQNQGEYNGDRVIPSYNFNQGSLSSNNGQDSRTENHPSSHVKGQTQNPSTGAGWKRNSTDDSNMKPPREDHNYNSGLPQGTTSAPRRPSSPQPTFTHQLVHFCSQHVKFDSPGTKVHGSDFSKSFCCPVPESHTADDVADNPRDVNNHLRQFALDLLIKLVESEPEKNLVVSPFSVWNVLLMTLEGAPNDSTTAQEIRKTLYLEDMTTAKIRSNFKSLACSLQAASNYSKYIGANALFHDIRRPASTEFVRNVQNKYQSDILPLNMSRRYVAAKGVNDWVANKTYNRIKQLVTADDFNQPLGLVITNAIYFKGQWEIPFNRTATSKQNFYNEKRKIVSSVDMMYEHGPFLYSFIPEINSHVLDIPYEGLHFRMLIVLPKYNETLAEALRGMKRFPVNLCYERLIAEQELYADEEVHVFLPRFKIKSDLQLTETLKHMGIQTVFTRHANLSNISPVNDLFLSKVVHTAEIEVNEEGTVASAATAGQFGNKSKPPNFVANRPFAYFIVENVGKTVIFAGKINDPNRSYSRV